MRISASRKAVCLRAQGIGAALLSFFVCFWAVGNIESLEAIDGPVFELFWLQACGRTKKANIGP